MVSKRMALLLMWALLCGQAVAAPFSRPDQVGQRLMDAGKPAEAAIHFRSPQHRARALYDAGDTAGAMKLWSEIGDAHSEYNLGTVLTESGAYQKAIDAFDRAAALPETPEGNAVNRDIAEKLLALAEAEQQSSTDDSQPPDQSDSGGDADQQDAGAAEPSDSEEGDSEASREESAASTPEQNNDDESDPQQQASRESQQAAEQLLNRVPDDPAGLLRARIVREHERRHGGAGDAEQPW